MGEGKHYEIERKYLIAMPDVQMLLNQPGCAVWEIEQVYLTARPGETRRVRKVVEAGESRWYKTFKRRVNDLRAEEDEGRISEAEYEGFLLEADASLQPIRKVRYRVPHEGQVLEFDLYPFWKDRAVLEIELESEEEPSQIPDWVKVIRDVTSDVRYKNVRLAAEVPMDEI